MKKKGFTLIELLAVILILGIIALIAIPTINNILQESRLGAFNTTASELGKAAEKACQLEMMKNTSITTLYTLIDGEFDHQLDIKGKMPDNGYILVNNNCEVAYSFYDNNHSASKSFNEDKTLTDNKDSVAVYGLEWRSNISSKADTYKRLGDAASIEDANVKVQVGSTPVTNAFDELDIYKDILPYTDSYGNEFMLIPKFYIKKAKVTTDTEVIWEYFVSKQMLDNDYYLPANFVDEGTNNDKYIELPYVLVGKYEGGSNGLSGNDEMLVSKSGLAPRVNINIVDARKLATRYNSEENTNGYQMMDIHVHDLLTTLFIIEFKTMNSQNIMRGFVDGNTAATLTGGSNQITSSSGTLANDGKNSFHYRSIENLWGNIWSFIDGVNINNDNSKIYASSNSRLYSSGSITTSYNLLGAYTKLNTEGWALESGFDSNFPYLTLPTKVGGSSSIGSGDYYYMNTSTGYRILLAGGGWTGGTTAGISHFTLSWASSFSNIAFGGRILKTPLQG